jgi:hypothetical protein
MNKKNKKAAFKEIILKDALHNLEKSHGLHKDADESYKEFQEFTKEKNNKASHKDEQINWVRAAIHSVISINRGYINNLSIGLFAVSIIGVLLFLNNSQKIDNKNELIFRSAKGTVIEVQDKDKVLADYIEYLNLKKMEFKVKKSNESNEIIITYDEIIDTFLFEKNIEPTLDKEGKFIIIIKE